jgi:hypothetical protein
LRARAKTINLSAMRFSRNQITGSLIVLGAILLTALSRLFF